MEYTGKVIEHFSNPRNVGEIPDADGVGTIGSEECGDIIKVWIKVADEHLADVKYKVFGCPAAIACCSMITELAIGKHVDKAWELADDHVAEALGGLPADKYHCSNLAASALHKAIMNYVFKNPSQSSLITITTLVNNTAKEGFQSEHGLSFWIEYGDKQVLFDTGQSDIFVQNAKTLGINLAEADAIILSHGHYDHTGGLDAVLNIAAKAKIYLHPAAIEPKFSQKTSGAESIGMPDSAREAIRNHEVIWTETLTQIFPGVKVTGQIPRNTNFEDVGGNFFVDVNCKKPDTMPDDQAMFFDSPKGLIIILGCAHAGVVNTLHYVAKLSGGKHIYAVIGGMHLLNAPEERIEHTMDVFRQYDVQKIGLAHCTGGKAVEKFKSVFPGRCFMCFVGKRIELK
jgi:7,8-dihydropterin-6-yl-methyl-4-(beta-D-ribofuranosyl)aminobenzene 5'-phosphate synthase